MSQSTNTSVINFCDVCNLSFESKKGLYSHQSYDLKHRELLEKMFKSEEEISERVYNSDEDDYIIKTKTKTETKTKTDIFKIETKTETETETKTEPCWVCGDKFKNQIGLQTHMNKHMRESVISTNPRIADNYTIKSSFNQRQLYITKPVSYINDINEPIEYILDGFKPLKSHKYKVAANCLYKKRGEDETQTTPINFRTDEFMTKDHRLDLNQWLDNTRENYEGYGCDYEFLGITDIQLNIERTKPSLGLFVELPPNLRTRTKAILNIKSNKFNCLRLCITAALYTVTQDATTENTYIKNLVDDWEYNETANDYITKIQNKYNIDIWFYRPKAVLRQRSTQDSNIANVERLEKCSNFVKGRQNVRIITWNERCALNKNVEVLLERPNTKHAKFWFCDNCTYWFSSQYKYETHECCVQIKPKNVCPKLKQIKFKNQHKQQEVNNVLFSDIECYMKGTDEKIGSNTYKISEHAPIAIGYSWHSRDQWQSMTEGQSENLLRRSYFGPDCIKDYVRDLLEIETKHSIQINKAMLFTEEDKMYHDANDICHICNKNCVNKVRDHCHQTGRYRGPACNICILNYKHQNFIPLTFHNGKGYEFNLSSNEIFKQYLNYSRRRIDISPSTNGNARMFRVVVVKFIDSYSFLTMSHVMTNSKCLQHKNKTLYPYEYFKDENSYNNKLGNLSIQDVRSLLTTKLQTQDEVDDFNNSNSNKTGKELTLEYMEKDIFILGHCFNLFIKLNMHTYKLNLLIILVYQATASIVS